MPRKQRFKPTRKAKTAVPASEREVIASTRLDDEEREARPRIRSSDIEHDVIAPTTGEDAEREASPRLRGTDVEGDVIAPERDDDIESGLPGERGWDVQRDDVE